MCRDVAYNVYSFIRTAEAREDTEEKNREFINELPVVQIPDFLEKSGISP